MPPWPGWKDRQVSWPWWAQVGFGQQRASLGVMLAVPWCGCALWAPLVLWLGSSHPIAMLRAHGVVLGMGSRWLPPGAALGGLRFAPPKDAPSTPPPLQGPVAASDGWWWSVRLALQCCPQPPVLLGATFAFHVMMPSVLNHARQPVLPCPCLAIPV